MTPKRLTKIGDALRAASVTVARGQPTIGDPSYAALHGYGLELFRALVATMAEVDLTPPDVRVIQERDAARRERDELRQELQGIAADRVECGAWRELAELLTGNPNATPEECEAEYERAAAADDADLLTARKERDEAIDALRTFAELAPDDLCSDEKARAVVAAYDAKGKP